MSDNNIKFEVIDSIYLQLNDDLASYLQEQAQEKITHCAYVTEETEE